ncbi:hypothetical protein ACEZCY_09750 [Streptacidiphilus sp. N1-12]|uniref:Uncharacterized protein n=2 Tax=Streptacidiphilus alkalitolerans TaxID=3342712 RepID=A0ABV6WBT6_9ACTN
METPHTVSPPLQRVQQGKATARDLLRLAPWALIVIVLGAVLCSPLLYLLALYLLLLDTWLQARPLVFVLVAVAFALFGLSVIGVCHQRGARARPGMVALARAASWWQLLLLPVLLYRLAPFLGGYASLLFGWLPFALLLQPLGTLLLRRTEFLLTGAALKAVVLVPPSLVLLLATPTSLGTSTGLGPHNSADDYSASAFLHLVGANGLALAAAIALAAYLTHRSDPPGT